MIFDIKLFMKIFEYFFDKRKRSQLFILLDAKVFMKIFNYSIHKDYEESDFIKIKLKKFNNTLRDLKVTTSAH